jgi:hypothetical protein
MLHACDTVRLYGTDFIAGVDPYHYYPDQYGSSDQTKYPEDRHWFALEHAIYEWWRSMGLLEIRP